MQDSASEFGRDLGLFHELLISGRKVGFTREDWARLVHNQSMLASCLDVARGVVPPIAYGPESVFANIWNEPKVPDKCTLLSHTRGPVRYDVRKTKFVHLHKEMSWAHTMRCIGMSKHANATLLQFFLAYPDMIPEECKDRSILFLGSKFYLQGATHQNHILRLEYTEKQGWHEEITLVGIPLRANISFALLG